MRVAAAIVALGLVLGGLFAGGLYTVAPLEQAGVTGLGFVLVVNRITGETKACNKASCRSSNNNGPLPPIQ